MDLEQAQRRALRVHALYDELNRREHGRVWTREEFMLGFVGDVGDLAKLVMAEEGARDVPGGRAALEHELADCLWSVLILARLHGVDLAAAFDRTMDELEAAVSGQLDSGGARSGRPGPARPDSIGIGPAGPDSVGPDPAGADPKGPVRVHPGGPDSVGPDSTCPDLDGSDPGGPASAP
ncbi:MazG nucleotide pyrophosphohydrolase domain-containing protein [Streptomyces sp. NPDC048639]|uniref:MazG nucleotide pyrophosphohydrolase domain-containing protein n=1 Tax=Streptomyces sp. NPDC048639 TaxID=3365581 RepID=UPI003723BE09